MEIPRLLGFVAIVSLLTAAVVGRRALRLDPGLSKVIAALLFCSAAGIATSYTRAPIVIWPLAFAILAAMIFLVWTLLAQRGSKEQASKASAGNSGAET